MVIIIACIHVVDPCYENYCNHIWSRPIFEVASREDQIVVLPTGPLIPNIASGSCFLFIFI